MRYGMPHILELKTTEANAALCRELGLAFVELSMCLPEYQTDKLDIARLAEVAERYGVYYTIHLDDSYSPCDFNDRIAAAYTETVLQTIDVAKKLAVPVVNMHLHPGTYFALPDRKVYLFDEYEAEFRSKLAAFRDACTQAVGGSGIFICVENCGDFGNKPYVYNGLELLLESPAFALTFDVGHNAAAGYTDEPAVMRHADRLRHMHIHDADGRSNHLALGDGGVNLIKYIDIARLYDCRAVLEVKTVYGLRKSVEWIKNKGMLHEMPIK